MSGNGFVELRGSDGIIYRGILRSYEDIVTRRDMSGLDKTKVTRYYYELECGRRTEMNDYGEHVIIGTNITLKPIDQTSVERTSDGLDESEIDKLARELFEKENKDPSLCWSALSTQQSPEYRASISEADREKYRDRIREGLD